MKRIIVLLLVALCSYGRGLAQNVIPHSEADDTAHIMGKDYWQLWNEDVQCRIDADIERNRKADANIQLGDVKRGSTVEIRQVKSAFYIGAQVFNFNQLGTPERNLKYRELWGTLFNSVTVPFYWKTYEPLPGQARTGYQYIDTEAFWNALSVPEDLYFWRRPAPEPIIDYMKERGVRVHGHTIVWGSRASHIPEWILDTLAPEQEREDFSKMIISRDQWEGKYTQEYKDLTTEQIEQRFPGLIRVMNEQFTRRMTDLADYYGDRVDSWDIVNESALDYYHHLLVPHAKVTKSHFGLMPGDYVYESFKLAESLFPKQAKLNINDYVTSHSYPDLVKDLLRRGCKIDVIGMQSHIFDPADALRLSRGEKMSSPHEMSESPEKIWQVFDSLSVIGLPIHISEITIPAPSADAHGEMIQAVLTRNLYRIWFSQERVNGITWWNVVDNCGLKGEPSNTGFFTRNMEPKASYYALDELVNKEWKTNLKLKATRKGEVHFRGFHGTYIISWIDSHDVRHEMEYVVE